MTWATDVVAHVRSGPARLGSGRLVCIDGPTGSGKTTLAAEVADRTGAPVVHLDDLYPGWTGLFDVDQHVQALLEPLAAGEPGRYRRFDWYAGEYRETHRVDPAPLLVLEGVGAGNRGWRHLATTLVWVDAPPRLRLERGVARDGEDQREHLVAWTRDEDQLFRLQDTRAHADLVLDTGPDGT